MGPEGPTRRRGGGKCQEPDKQSHRSRGASRLTRPYAGVLGQRVGHFRRREDARAVRYRTRPIPPQSRKDPSEFNQEPDQRAEEESKGGEKAVQHDLTDKSAKVSQSIQNPGSKEQTTGVKADVNVAVPKSTTPRTSSTGRGADMFDGLDERRKKGALPRFRLGSRTDQYYQTSYLTGG
ncbi:hypothetical protein Z517_09407 [Fonsecaea pedrosoi CBS 271.37]|uniref:Uncharacterized protein n=1 Tax=Fonsecaea pedrosoi CBS 271.37 TaxID=1442368 RepID=A0A0D2G8G1_9EURO|nr:uncharacterized protein Z517_09407 [Fonsecaea pedrosoi CBS 271.37]KIW76963.1 hypothetical protein Z517_09407 [Fonsecaea pedrosoi CBS 271.37]